MEMKEFIVFCKKGNPISGQDKELHELLKQCSYEAQKITMKLNTSYHSREEIVEIFSELTGNQVDSYFCVFRHFIQTLVKISLLEKMCFLTQGVHSKIEVEFK
ncbi:hypothetical protein V7266_14795 [Neobacillus drentensis]|uniref:hypothetical protein n=1 Tax=Neobacillus drentensis TaxID=220684 RepID=UPI002FFF8804